MQGEAAAEGAVLAVLDGFAATSNAFAFYRAAVFADDFFFLVVGGVADVGGCVVSGKEVGRFDKPEQIGGEAAEVLFFKAVGGFAGGCFALVFFAARVKQGGAQAAFEGAAGDVWGVAVRVGGGAFDTELVVFGLLVFLCQLVCRTADAVRPANEVFGICLDVSFDLRESFHVIFGVDSADGFKQFLPLPVVKLCPCRVEGVEGVVVDNVVGRFVIFAGAEVDGG